MFFHRKPRAESVRAAMALVPTSERRNDDVAHHEASVPQVLLVAHHTRRTVLHAALVAAGMEVTEAQQGSDAVALLAHDQPDLVMLDVAPPVLDGFEACRRLRALPGGRDTPVLLIVPEDMETIERAFVVGASDVITVPVNGAIVKQWAGHLVALRRTARVVHETQERFRVMADTAPVLFWMADPDGGRTFCNQRWLDFTGRTMDQEAGDGWLEGVHPDDALRCVSVYHAARSAQEDFEMEYRLRRADGIYRWVLDRGVARWTPDGSFAGVIGSCVDMTERKQIELTLQWANEELERHVEARTQELRDVNAQLRAELIQRAEIEEALRLRDRAVAAATNSIVITGPTADDNLILYVNPAFERLTGYPADEVIGRNCRMLQGADADPDTVAQLQAAVHQGQPCAVVMRNYRKDGSAFWNAITISPVHNAEGQVTHFVGVQDDVTAHKQVEDRLVYDALHDPLTGLANRNLCLEHLQHLLARVERHPASGFAVFFLDLDGFKGINDSLGHAAGDHVLVAVGRRLTTLLRPTDTVARFGGDEFAVLLDDIQDADAAMQLAERVQQELALPFTFQQQTIRITASVGIVLGTPSYAGPQDLLRDADRALYRAKADGKARAVIVSSADHERHVAPTLGTERQPARGTGRSA